MTAPRPSPVALVTGGASGMGAAIVQRMSADGHRVVVADLDEAAAALSGSELGAYSASKHGVVALVRSAAIEGDPPLDASWAPTRTGLDATTRSPRAHGVPTQR